MRVERLQQIFAALNAAETSYLVVGGIAVIAHGYQRLTVDVDLVIRLLPENIHKAMQALTALGYRPKVPVPAESFGDPELRERGITEKGMMVFQLACDEFRWEPIDIFVTEPLPFEEIYANAHWHDLGGGIRVPIVPKDQLLAMKREAGRDKDLVDIRELLEYDSYENERKHDESS